jgi:hypothetical protein
MVFLLFSSNVLCACFNRFTVVIANLTSLQRSVAYFKFQNSNLKVASQILFSSF